MEDLKVWHRGDSLFVGLADTGLLGKIHSGQVTELLIPVSYSNELYDNAQMVRDFYRDGVGDLTVAEFRRLYKHEYATVKFVFRLPNVCTTAKRCSASNPDWYLESSEYFKLTWDPVEA